ncbi:HAD hydrolase-like protein [Bdellovibrionota bacterium FG-2]
MKLNIRLKSKKSAKFTALKIRVRYVDEGTELRGTAGALRLALDQGVLDSKFLMTYGDSFLPVDFGAVWNTFLASGAPALMTVFKNEGQWDTSNVVFREGQIKLYDKFRTTRKNLEDTHQAVLAAAQAQGGVIQSSHICFHRSEDQCACRKPKTGLLEAAIEAHGGPAAWMIGDGITDIQAGASLGISTAFLGPQKCDACKIFEEMGLKPSFWGKDLLEFVGFLGGKRRGL